MDNLAYQEETWDEMIGGRIVCMSPRAVPSHNIVIVNLTRIFASYFKGKKCSVFNDVDVFLTRKDRFVPDMMVVCGKDTIKADGIHGTPDFVVEVLSPTSEKRDRQYKKKIYEECGVKEYWLINTASRTVEIYTLTGGRLELADVFTEVPDYLAGRMTEEEKASIVYEFSPVLFPELIINIEEIFEGIIS